MNEEHVIELRDVGVTFEGRELLNGVNLSVRNGEFCYLTGKTGSGKSTILKLLYRDAVPSSGRVRVEDMDVTKLPQRKIPFLRRRLGIVFQDFQLLMDRNVTENVAFALHVTGHKSRVVKERVLNVLAMVGLSHRRKAMPSDLSGGEQQRVVIARALANEPRIMLADEPTGNLDPEAATSIMDLFQKINHQGMAVLMVTHDYQLIRRYPNRTIRIEDGRLLEAPKLSAMSL